MSTLSKYLSTFVHGLKPKRVETRGSAVLELPTPQTSGGIPLMDAIARRRSSREFSTLPLPLPLLSNLLWAAFGINRPLEAGRTAPSALNAQEIDVYAALSSGLYIYEPKTHSLHLVAEIDARRVTGYQDFVDEAPLDLVYVADYAHLGAVPRPQRTLFSGVSAGAISQNVYLYAASAGLVCVVRELFDQASLRKALELSEDEQVILTQTVGYPAG